MTAQSVALAADGSFQLVRVLGSGDVYGLDARILAAGAHQSAVVIAARSGVTDTHILSMLLGVGQLLLPAIAWSLALLLTRSDRVVCASVMMVAGLSAGATWFISVSEIVLAVPLTVVVAVLLWQPRPWRHRDVALAVVASVVLVASYETALLTGSILTVWAVWRATGATVRTERVGCSVVGALSLLSVFVAVGGSRAGSNPTHSQSFLYYVVSLEPWPFYVALLGIAIVTIALGPWVDGAQRVTLVAGCILLIVSAAELEPGAVTAFQARGGAAVAGVLLEIFLLWRWIGTKRDSATLVRRRRPVEVLLVAIPVLFTIAMVAANVQPVRSWSRSMDAFRSAIDENQDEVLYAADTLRTDERAVLWGWTSSSLSLLVRGTPSAGLLVDRNPSIVPFPTDDARAQLADSYTWGE
jgi:hypothetical protein